MTPRNIAEPLVVTVRLDSTSQKRFQDLRDRYFPADRNIVPAHISMYHALPPHQVDRISADLKEATNIEAFTLRIAQVVSIGRGVMYGIESPELLKLHQELSAKWIEWLIPQDRQKYKPHIVVQNKVEPSIARETYTKLSEEFSPSEAMAESVVLWLYRGGPWEELYQFPFAQR